MQGVVARVQAVQQALLMTAVQERQTMMSCPARYGRSAAASPCTWSAGQHHPQAAHRTLGMTAVMLMRVTRRAVRRQLPLQGATQQTSQMRSMG
jgi:hypothetical protein